MVPSHSPSVTIDDLVSAYPAVYHMTEAGAWASIRRLGLRSTTALLDLFEYAPGPQRDRIESEHRRDPVTIHHDLHGTAVIRDQKPLNPTKLARCLVGMPCCDWYRLLNSKVFFWVAERRVQELSRAAAYRGRSHDVMIVDTRRLVERHGDRVRLSPINGGATLYNPPARGPSTFRTVEEFPWESHRGRGRGVIAELTVGYAVTDVDEIAIRVKQIRNGMWGATVDGDV